MHNKCNNPCNHALKDQPIAHLPPSSLLIEAIAATHGVYKRQKIKSAAAPAVFITAVSAAVDPNKIERVETTLSFAINPEISAVDILQSPNPSGMNTGAIIPATVARILACESVTIFRCRSKLCRNQITIVAPKITVNALCRKSFAFSQRS